jgi:HSP20 family molecular chaperone IbpA
MSPIIQQDEDPDVDIVQTQDYINVYVDLRGREIKSQNLKVKAEKDKIYIYDLRNNSILKIIKLPTLVDPIQISYEIHYGTVYIKLKRVN